MRRQGALSLSKGALAVKGLFRRQGALSASRGSFGAEIDGNVLSLMCRQLSCITFARAQAPTTEIEKKLGRDSFHARLSLVRRRRRQRFEKKMGEDSF